MVEETREVLLGAFRPGLFGPSLTGCGIDQCQARIGIGSDFHAGGNHIRLYHNEGLGEQLEKPRLNVWGQRLVEQSWPAGPVLGTGNLRARQGLGQRELRLLIRDLAPSVLLRCPTSSPSAEGRS
jgi:hypothetical protein